MKLTSTNRPFGLIIKLSQNVFERGKRRSPSLSQYVRLRVEPVNCQPNVRPLMRSYILVDRFAIAQFSVVAIAPGSADIFIGGSLAATAKKFAVVVGF